MEANNSKNHFYSDENLPEAYNENGINSLLRSYSKNNTSAIAERIAEFIQFFKENLHINLDELAERLATTPGKRSFLVLKNNKYFIVPSMNVAFFCIRPQSTQIMCFDGQEFSVNHSLEYIQTRLSEKQFFRLNRQYLINFSAVKEVERYFERKLLVKLLLPVPDKLIVSKEKSIGFLHWLDDK